MRMFAKTFETHKRISRIFATCNKKTSVSITNKWTHRKQTHRSKQDIYQHDWPTSTDYQTNQHIWYVSGSEILAVWLRKGVCVCVGGCRNSDMEAGDEQQRTERGRTTAKEGKEEDPDQSAWTGIRLLTGNASAAGMFNIYSFKTRMFREVVSGIP